MESNGAQTVTKSCPSMADNSSMVPCNAPRMVALMKTVPRTPRMVQPVMVRRPRVPRAGGFELPQEEEEEEPQEKLPSRLAIPSATSASAWSSYQASTSASASTSAWCQSTYQYKCLCKYQCHCQNLCKYHQHQCPCQYKQVPVQLPGRLGQSEFQLSSPHSSCLSLHLHLYFHRPL